MKLFPAPGAPGLRVPTSRKDEYPLLIHVSDYIPASKHEYPRFIHVFDHISTSKDEFFRFIHVFGEHPPIPTKKGTTPFHMGAPSHKPMH